MFWQIWHKCSNIWIRCTNVLKWIYIEDKTCSIDSDNTSVFFFFIGSSICMLFMQSYRPVWLLCDWMLLFRWWWDLASSHQEGEGYRQPAVTQYTMRKQRGVCAPEKTDWTNRRPRPRPGRTLHLLSQVCWRYVQVWSKSERPLCWECGMLFIFLLEGSVLLLQLSVSYYQTV